MTTYHGSELYDRIGVCYDCTRRADPYILSRLQCLLALDGDAKLLDLACGTGNYTVGLADMGLSVTGIDISDTMLSHARQKSSSVSWVKGAADCLPFEDGAFDGCVCTLAIHHFGDLTAAFREVSRVIGQGRFVLFTCTHEQIRQYWLYRYFPEVMETMISYMPDLPLVTKALAEAGFSAPRLESYDLRDDLVDCFLGYGKNAPELYLDSRFRDGMSIFAAKAKESDVLLGCERLEREIRSGACQCFLAEHRNPCGDYLFITVEKQ